MSMSLYDLVLRANKPKSESLTKEEFGRIMHDPDSTEEEISEALQMLSDAGGYDCLGD